MSSSPASPKAHSHVVPLDYSFMGLAALSGTCRLSRLLLTGFLIEHARIPHGKQT